MKITRRKLAAAVAASVTAPLLAQAPAPRTPDQELQAARDRMKSNGDKLAAQSVPMSTEPAFQFRA